MSNMETFWCRAKTSGKDKDPDKWAAGYYYHTLYDDFILKSTPVLSDEVHHYSFDIDPDTLGRWSGFHDKNMKGVYEGDIIQFEVPYWSEIIARAEVCYGKYGQDGSFGEYSTRECLGWYYQVLDYDLPSWQDPDLWSGLQDYEKVNSLLQVVDDCEVIGNVFDNVDL